MAPLALIIHAADAPASAPSADLVTALLAYGPGGVMLALVISGLLVPRAYLAEVRADRDAWRAAFETERAGHDITRAALGKSEDRGTVAVEQGKMLTMLLRETGHQPASAATGGTL